MISYYEERHFYARFALSMVYKYIVIEELYVFIFCIL